MEIKFRAPYAIDATCFRSCVCAMAWRFHTIDARLPPFLRLLDGVQVDEGLGNRSQDNLTHCLISTQRWDFCSRASAAASANGVLPRRAWSILLGRTTASKALSTGAVSLVARRSNATTSRHRSA